MIFNEIYGCYYNTVAKLLSSACIGELTRKKIVEIVKESAYAESLLMLLPSLEDGRWPLLNDDYSTVIKNKPTMPLTELEKRWLKTILTDKRAKLFDLPSSMLDDVEPLFTSNDYFVFDKFNDGDNYDDERYIFNFRILLNAINQNKQVKLLYNAVKSNKYIYIFCLPKRLEYSEKDDKFRLKAYVPSKKDILTYNLSKIISCDIVQNSVSDVNYECLHKKDMIKTVTFELINERNLLERAMMSFNHFEKEIYRTDDGIYPLYTVNLRYRANDEAELIIRILSFGKYIKVTEPQSFKSLISERLKKQYLLMQAMNNK